MDKKIQGILESEMKENSIVLYMIGTPLFPMESESAFAAQALDALKVPYQSFDLTGQTDRLIALEKMTKSEDAPFLFIKKKFIGGNKELRRFIKDGIIENLLKQNSLL
jgi:monothiol glutaredoxin